MAAAAVARAGHSDLLRATMQNFRTPITPDTDSAATAAQLNEERLRLLDEAFALALERCWVGSARREYNVVHDLTPTNLEPSRVAEVRHRGGAIGRALGANPPVYDTPVKNMRVAEAAMADLERIRSEAS